MADCTSDITSRRDKACKGQNGGVSSLYLFNYLESPFTVTSGVATAMNIGLTAAYEYKIEGDGNTLTEVMTPSSANGTTVNLQTIVAQLKKIDASTSAEMNLLAKGYPMAVIKDRNGIYHAVGIEDGIDFVVTSLTGSAREDFNGFQLSGTSKTKELSAKLDSATTTAFLLVVT